MATTEQFSLRWNNFHSNLTSGFHDLLQANDMVDVTLAVEGQFLQAHKIVLSICSPLFKQLFKINPCKHPVIILRDVTYGNLKDILEFMYLGEVNVLRDNLSAFLRTAELLQVKGLTGDDSSDTSSKKDEKLDSVCDNELDQDMQQFSQLIESSDSSLMPHYSSPQLPSPPPIPALPVSNIKRPAKISVGNSKRAKSDPSSSQLSKASTKTVEKQERSSTPTQISEDDPEYVESPNLKAEAVAYGSESEDTVSNRDVIKQLLESNNVNLSTTQDSGSQDHAGHLQQQFRAAQYRGLPLPILWIVDYFVIDGEGFRFGRFYRTAGWYTHIVLWTAFPCWLLANIFFRSVIRYGAYFLGMAGGLLLMGNLLWLVIRNPNPLVIPFEDATITTKFGFSYWLTFFTGITCLVLSIIILFFEATYDTAVSIFFGIDPLTYLDEYVLTQKELEVLRRKDMLPRDMLPLTEMEAGASNVAPIEPNTTQTVFLKRRTTIHLEGGMQQIKRMLPPKEEDEQPLYGNMDTIREEQEKFEMKRQNPRYV